MNIDGSTKEGGVSTIWVPEPRPGFPCQMDLSKMSISYLKPIEVMVTEIQVFQASVKSLCEYLIHDHEMGIE